MADTHTAPTTAPVTFEALMAERKAFWGSFTSAATIATVVVIGIVVLMAIFLV
jgi:hypothetical protein